MKKGLSIASLVVGVIGLGVFFQPIIEIICGVVGLVFALFAKDSEAGHVIDGIRHWGLNFAWINIIWVCIEFGLKLAGIELF